MSEIVDIPVPQTVKEKTVEVVKVIPQERVSERTVEQIVREIPRARGSAAHRGVRTTATAPVEYETSEVSEKSAAPLPVEGLTLTS